MTDWTQFHPTRTLTAPDGRDVEIEVEMVPLVRELWRLGIQTKVACQDAGEAVREGGTRVAEPDRLQTSVRLMGRAWLVVQRTDAPRLMGAAGCPGDWLMKPVKKGHRTRTLGLHHLPTPTDRGRHTDPPSADSRSRQPPFQALTSPNASTHWCPRRKDRDTIGLIHLVRAEKTHTHMQSTRPRSLEPSPHARGARQRQVR